MPFRQPSTLVSTRETKNDATEAIESIGSPLAARRARPLIYISITAQCRSREKIKVTLTLMPASIAYRIAGKPSRVAGIFTIRLGRFTRFQSRLASDNVACESFARYGLTSRLT